MAAGAVCSRGAGLTLAERVGVIEIIAAGNRATEFFTKVGTRCH